MLVNKMQNFHGSNDILLTDGEKVLIIQRTGNDCTISCKYKKYKRISTINFEIKKEDEQIYSIFDRLYTDIIDGNVLGEDRNNEHTKEDMEYQKHMSWYNEIVQGNIINIICDAYPRKCPNILKIKKEDNKIFLEFIKIEGDEYKEKNTVSINIRQSGSRLYDFAIPFMTLFYDLQELEENDVVIKKLSYK